MNIELKSVLARMNFELEDFFQRETLNILHAFNPELKKDNEQLRKQILILNSPQSLLLKKNTRDLLINALKENEADELVKQLGISDRLDSWTILREQSFTGNKKKELLFNFFNVKLGFQERKEKPDDCETIKAKYSLFDHQNKAINEISTILNPKNGGDTAQTDVYCCICQPVREKLEVQ